MTITDGKYEILKGTENRSGSANWTARSTWQSFIDAVRANDRSRLNAEVEEVFCLRFAIWATSPIVLTEH